MERLKRMQFKQALKRTIKHKIPLIIIDPCSASQFLKKMYLLDFEIKKTEYSEIIKLYTSFNPEEEKTILFLIESHTEELNFFSNLNKKELIIGNTTLHSEFDANFILRKWEEQ